MSTSWTKCQYHRHHRTQAEAAACPSCLSTLAAPSRRRRNAVVDPMLPGSLEPELDAASSTSWETLPWTPQSSRAVTPAEIERSTAAATYPTPTCSQNNQMKHRGAVSRNPESPTRATFTARSESPVPPPPSPASGNSVRYSYDLLGNLETTRLPQTAPRNTHTTPPPPVSPPPPMAPRKRPNTRSTAPATTTQTPETPAAVALALTDADTAIPSIEPADPTNDAHEDQLNAIRASRNDLRRQLEDSTALIARLHTRAAIATADRDRAFVARDEAQAELEVLQREKVKVGCRLVRCLMEVRALVAIAGVYLVWRLVLFKPEFEYIARRSGEVFGGLL